MDQQVPANNEMGEMINAMKSAFENMSVAPKTEIPKYNGRDNPMYFLLSFRLATENMTEAKKLAVFRQAMQGNAYVWFCGKKLADDLNDDYVTCEDWEQRLQAAFGKTEDSAQDELEARQQTETESVSEYVQDVLRLCSEVDPAMSEKKRLRYLQKGLLERYRHDMLVMDPRDTGSFQEKLFKLTTNSKSAQPFEVSDRALLNSLVAHMVQKKDTPVLAAAATAAPAPKSMEEIMSKILEQLAELKRPRKPVQCWTCGQTGHPSRLCKQTGTKDAPAAENMNARSS